MKMARPIEPTPTLSKRDKKQMESVYKKIDVILENPQHCKNFKKPLSQWKRVHVGSFVLTFSVDENTKTMTLEDYDHHDYI
jgi:mRNA-degrading endonuclease RelE of RelBE toxin-antitoxin system